MKRLIAFLLALVMTLAVFAACGEEKKPEANNNVDKPSDNTSDEETPRVFESKEIEAVVVTAEAFLARKSFLQYDDLSMVASLSGMSSIRRPDRLKYGPEDATSQFTWYTNCASFTYDVYYQAWGQDIIAWTTSSLKQAVDMTVWDYTVTFEETDGEKESVLQEFESLVKPGDILVCHHKGKTSGHAMLYIGDGQIIHSSGSGGGSANYDYGKNTDNFEAKGTVQSKTLESLRSGGDNYYFFGEGWWGIIRPSLRYTEAKATEEAINRINNMQGIVAEKQTTATVGHTVKAGDEITFTFQIKNSNKVEKTLEVVETLPAALTYVSGCDNVSENVLKWSVTVPASSTEKISYTVKVADSVKNGDKIESTSTIGGVDVNSRPVYVGNNLSADQQTAIDGIIAKTTSATVYGTDLAEKIYADAGITISLDAAKDIVNGMYSPYNKTTTHFQLNKESKYFNMVAPTMYGGYYVVTDKLTWGGYRTKTPQANQLMVGDIIIMTENDKVSTYMMASGLKAICLDEGKVALLSLLDTKNILTSTIGQDKFVIIRPAMAQ